MSLVFLMKNRPFVGLASVWPTRALGGSEAGASLCVPRGARLVADYSLRGAIHVDVLGINPVLSDDMLSGAQGLIISQESNK